MSNTHSSFLKEMGITQWTSKDAVEEQTVGQRASNESIDSTSLPVAQNRAPQVHWWFFGNQVEGEAKTLFQNMVRVLGLHSQEWSWKSPSDNLSQFQASESGLPVVAIAFGGAVAQKITGERDLLPQLRETVLALNTGNDDEIPVIATFELAQIIAKPQDKALLWQDLLLAKSVLQNI